MVVRSSADVVGGVLLVGLAGVLALLVGLRFAALAHRAEDDLFEVVGAPGATLRRIAAWQGALVTVVGVSLGAAVGLIGTASASRGYNSHGRGELPPIPFDVPGPLLIGLLVLPWPGPRSHGRRPSPAGGGSGAPRGTNGVVAEPVCRRSATGPAVEGARG